MSKKTFAIPKNNYVVAVLKTNAQREWKKFVLFGHDMLAYMNLAAPGVIKFSLGESDVVVCDIVCARNSQEVETIYKQFCKLAEVKNGNSGTGRTVTPN